MNMNNYLNLIAVLGNILWAFQIIKDKSVIQRFLTHYHEFLPYFHDFFIFLFY